MTAQPESAGVVGAVVAGAASAPSVAETDAGAAAAAAMEARLSKLSPERRRLYEQLRRQQGRNGAPAAPTGAPAVPEGGVVMRPARAESGSGPGSGSDSGSGSGSGRRLILIHPSGGQLFCYVPLVRALKVGAEVIGFAADPVDRRTALEQRVVGEATRILGALRRQAEATGRDLGRDVLAGWSYGGSVAFEAARQLAASGGPTPPVVLLDPPFIEDLSIPIPDEAQSRRQFAYDLGRLQGVPAERLDAVLGGVDGEGGTGTGADIPLPEVLAAAGIDLGLGPQEVVERFLTFVTAATALHRYQPPAPYPGAVTLLTAGPEPEITAGWRRSTTGEFRHRGLTGDHYTVFDAENLPVVVDAVERALTKH
jgi:thioesterase domain-containing protein